MKGGDMVKTILMLIGLAVVVASGTACFGLFRPSKDKPAGSTIEECAGLSGEAKTTCEERHKH
jgi:hypothetical protein